MSVNEPLMKHRKDSDDTKTGVSPRAPGAAWKVPIYWPCGVRCTGGMTLIRAFVRNLRTGSVMVREKAPVDDPRGRKYRCADQAHCLVRAMKRGNARGAKGAGHPHQDGVNGQPE